MAQANHLQTTNMSLRKLLRRFLALKLSCDGLLGLFVSSVSSVIMAAVTVGV
jgi:hypothetical protein